MLTPAQQKIRQELEELQIKGLLQTEQKNIHPQIVHQSNRDKSGFRITGTVLFIFVLLIFSLAIYNKITIEMKESLISYLAKAQKLNRKGDRILDNIRSEPSPSRDKIIQALSMQRKLNEKAKDLKAPANFSELKSDFLTVNEERLKILTDMLKNNLTGMTPSLNQLYVKQELEKDRLIRAFQKASIKYKKYENGTIQYWYKKHSYVYGV
ncbi:hypothetical protein E2K98_08895 [Bacillus salipaludis]|uniref:Uncharacterized protein n=1 Tax=Bacillus salipaludis TaxID=2547811 RepID=A0A4R5VT85_9BACI|nr:hypothetical protein [Bacillus salipaludis]TDK62171.1 hypothetical protein E2K98_08895 [Bacillus salipaludis]